MLDELMQDMEVAGLPGECSGEICEPPEEGERFVAWWIDGGTAERTTLEVTEVGENPDGSWLATVFDSPPVKES